MGKMYGTYWRQERSIQGFGGGVPEGKTQLVRPRRRWEAILKRVFRKWDGGMDWIDLAQDRECGK